MNELEKKCREYAKRCHEETNHKYDGVLPYLFHLTMVNAEAQKFLHLIPSTAQDIVLSSTWTHDVIEDTRQTYNDVLEATGSKEVADITYALTNEKGRNRKERANSEYYHGIEQTPLATFVKVCDRIANVKYSISQGNTKMLEIYREENKHFAAMLHTEELNMMFENLDKLLTK